MIVPRCPSVIPSHLHLTVSNLNSNEKDIVIDPAFKHLVYAGIRRGHKPAGGSVAAGYSGMDV